MGMDESPHGSAPATESHARPDGCDGHHLRFCENGKSYDLAWYAK